MKTFYLVDYENGPNRCMIGCEFLKATDTVMIFYSDATPNIKLDAFVETSTAKLMTKRTTKGEKDDQNIDKLITSYMGYLIGSQKPEDIEIVIVSNDRGYDKIISFWKEENEKLRISRRAQILKSILFENYAATLQGIRPSIPIPNPGST